MIGQTISHYGILEKLGEGGMGVVYKAQDLKLDRVVALKFLPEKVSVTADDRARFLQEAKAASAVTHPNVCIIYDIAESEGRQFIVMEYVDGVTLREKITGEDKVIFPAPVNDVVSYAIQIGEALHEAHSKGIVHRDVKPENIMINTKNQIKVMDFGLAKLKGSLKITRTSSTIGTLAYMSPEQIRGGEVDSRSDIFSFGVVIYEMLAGSLPFRGEHEAAMMYSIVNEEPEPIQKYCPEISPEFLHVVNRALEKNPDDRYQSVAEMVIDLKRLKKETTRVVRPAIDEKAGQVASPSRIGLAARNWKWIIAVVAIALAAGAYFIFLQKAEKIDSLAVMPFVNVAVDPDVEYLSDGITESIINSLSQHPSLRVVPRSTVFRYKGKEIDHQEVAQKLNVRAILTGKLVQRGDNLSIQVELVDAVRQSQLWGEQFSRKSGDLLNIQQDIVREVSKRLEGTLGGQADKQLSKGLTNDNEAFQLYLKGRYYWNKRSEEGLKKSLECFEKAIEKDPSYALAYAGIADAYIVMGDWRFLRPKRPIRKRRLLHRRLWQLMDRLEKPRRHSLW